MSGAEGADKSTRKGRLQSRLMLAFLAISATVVAVFAILMLVSLRSLESTAESNTTALAEHALDKDLSVAHRLKSDHEERIAEAVVGLSRRSGLIEAMARGDETALALRLKEYETRHVHFLTLVDARGIVLSRLTGPARGDDLSSHRLVKAALDKRTVSGVWVEEPKFLDKEGLAERARVKISGDSSGEAAPPQEERGLVAGAVAPVIGPNGQLLGAVIGGFLHNRDYTLVDLVRSTVYQDKENAGTATMFLDDVRVSTNVLDKGQRAIGTRVSPVVKETVLRQGKHYRGRAEVVHEWYMSGYEPIRDVDGNIVGMLYVGVQEKPFKEPYQAMYAGMRSSFLWSVGVAALLSGALSIAIGLWLARRITRPLAVMTGSVERLSNGDLTAKIAESDGKDEISDLQNVLRAMSGSLYEMVKTNRDGMKALTSSASQIAVTAKQAQATAAEQASAVQEVGSTIEEIGATSRVVVERAQEVVEISEHAVEGGQRGIQAVGEAQKGLELLGRIVEIVDTVNELAEQSNVLAVNAAIEAARAGERGKGFAVVAGEVRSLAGQSKKAAKQIREILARVESSGAAISHANTVIHELGEVLERTADRARQIAAAAGQQAAGMKQMGEAMDHVVRGGRDTADGARQLESAVSSLSALAKQLQDQSARYRV